MAEVGEALARADGDLTVSIVTVAVIVLAAWWWMLGGAIASLADYVDVADDGLLHRVGGPPNGNVLVGLAAQGTVNKVQNMPMKHNLFSYIQDNINRATQS